MYDAVDKDLNAKHKLDELVLVHNEMVTQFCTTIDNIEEELVRTTHTIKYLNEATAKLKEAITNG
jgi:predicted transcriptional regulator